ncbi:MAG: metallophosphoesterase, partial [Gammaproteobacteria bacterium]|nr:metallophosphoesterase [Gammaproteobacteria bacterium]
MNHKARLILLCAALLVSTSVFAQCDPNRTGIENAHGFVFADINENGMKDAMEPGIASIPVSNGCEVVLSNSDGSYSLSVAPTEVLFISKPADFQIPVDEFNVPQFFYRHYPEGVPAQIAGTSVEWLWPVSEASGPLPDSVNFPLVPITAVKEDFLAHGFADTQAQYENGQDMIREELVNPLIGNPFEVEFGLTVGDVVFDNLALYDRHKTMMGLMDIPQWYLPGNHDMNFESPNARYANETYIKHFGPTYYSFNYGNVHFVALNNVEYAGDGREFDRGVYRGYISDVQLQWLRNDLAHVSPDKLIVIASHIPLIAEASDGVSAVLTGPGTENFSELLEILEPFEHLYGLAGHDTSNSFKVEVNHQHGWNGRPWIAHTLGEVRGSGWTRGPRDFRGVRDAMMEDGNPNGFYVLRFNDSSLIPEFIPFPSSADGTNRMRVVLDPPLIQIETGSVQRGILQSNTKLVVNLFDGGIRDQVWASIDGGAQQQMI